MPSLFNLDLAENLLTLPVLILSLTVHEWAHAWSAWKLGDDTASREGRLTLNPMPHIDLLGTIVLPLLGAPIGWAKPVPVNPSRFRRSVNMSAGMAITASAGPLSNLVLAVGCAVGLGLMFRFGGMHKGPLQQLLIRGLFMNVALAVFNLIPIPPLDGSRIVDHFVPAKHREAWDSFARFAPILLVVVIVAGAAVLAGPINAVTGVLVNLVFSIAGTPVS